MVPVGLNNFLIVSATASATFIGLLFVALSVVLYRNESNSSYLAADRVLAESSYSTLINVFFISLTGLITGINLGYVILIMALVGLTSIFRGRNNEFLTKKVWLLAFSLVGLVLQAGYGFYLIVVHNPIVNKYVLLATILISFIFGLARAWELTGIRRR